ncbi:MAG TPA: twin transmembrane helix small protein [Coxiellaceae bacterium]|nr:twin transmembrane helix small protein [Coxiellaceae bacterium]
MKIIILIIFAIILYCLGSAAYYLVKAGSNSERLAWALTWRISLSIALFALLIFSAWMGWVHPHGISA